MNRNKIVQKISQLISFREGFFTRFLLPQRETHLYLFGKYKFQMDLALGRLQKIFFLKPNSYEREMQQALRKFIKPGMVVFDVGANIGYFTLLMADLVGPTGRVYSFEPFKPNFALLETNVRSNDLSQVNIYPIAFSDHPGNAILSINPVNDGGHTLGDLKDNPDLVGWDRENLRETVQVDTVDAFINEKGIDHIDLIKIDVEGAECLVFAGAKNLLSGTRAPTLLCEVGDVAQHQSGHTEKDLRALLYKVGYKSYWLNDSFQEFGLETPVRGLINVLFTKECVQ